MSTSAELLRIIGAKSALKNAINAKNDADHQITNQLIDQYAPFVGYIQTGGETYVKDLTASASGLDVSTLGNGIYHGKKKTPTTQQNIVIELYCMKQGSIVVFFVKNKGGSFRRNVNDNNLIYPNSSSYLFDASDFAIYKVADMNWEV